MPRLAHRTEFLRQSEIRNMTRECVRLGGVNLSQGVCDTPVPEMVRRAAQAAIDEGCNTYTRFDGLDELRAAIARKLQRDNGLTFDPRTEIIVTSGSSAAFYGASLAVFDPGDEAVLFEPYYGYHLDTLRVLDVTPRFVTLKAPAWHFHERDLEASITDRTRAIVLNTPANPSGKVFSRAELEIVAKVAERHDLFVFTDEIYEYFVYDDRQHVSPAALGSLADRTITISGFSKTLSITGWRIGFAACPAHVAGRLGFLNDLVYICAPAPLQMGVARALDVLGSDFYASLAEVYRAKREKICEALARANLSPIMPQGAYYVLANTSKIPGETSKARVMHLLERTGVAAVPGSAFFHDGGGEELARFCFAKTDEDLNEACRRLEAVRW